MRSTFAGEELHGRMSASDLRNAFVKTRLRLGGLLLRGQRRAVS